ncbi:MAG: hypothetical protein JZU58_19315 [Curvibacter lanceolatus]|uniref:hypothetical protein n=1 Tax=Curvibacter lanceolatus TaxID=86182 RepID=UPI000362C143|nr:hypothetical protein [Curvibacter lanceolatus]MBV5294496.1 hypothetical protein [Curvibacter lanceolatus]
MATLNIGDCLGAAWAQYRKNMLTHIVATVLVTAIGNLFFGLLTGPLLVGYMRMMRAEEAGQPVSFTDVFRGFDDFGPALLAAVLAGILVAVGFCFCVLPGLLLLPLVPLALHEVAEGEKDAIQAIKTAWGQLRPNLFMALICSFLISVFAGIGALLCGVGIVLTLPLAYLGAYHMARQMAGDPRVVIAL